MRKKTGKYIASVHPRYVETLFEYFGCNTEKEKCDVWENLASAINSFVKREQKNETIIMERIEIDGRYITPITFSPIPNFSYINRIAGGGKKKKNRKRNRRK